MRFGSFLGALVGVSLLSVASLAHAQCTKDTDCKGERVCEEGACVEPAPLPPPPAAPASADAAPTEPAAAVDPKTTPEEPAAAPASPTLADEVAPKEEPAPVKGKRRSTGMMVGGIVMVSVAPVALLMSLIASTEQRTCRTGGKYFGGNGVDYDDYSNCDRFDKTIYGGAIVGLGLLGVGIPFIVVGAKRQPAVAHVAPWATPRAAGIKLSLDL